HDERPALNVCDRSRSDRREHEERADDRERARRAADDVERAGRLVRGGRVARKQQDRGAEAVQLEAASRLQHVAVPQAAWPAGTRARNGRCATPTTAANVTSARPRSVRAMASTKIGSTARGYTSAATAAPSTANAHVACPRTSSRSASERRNAGQRSYAFKK